MDLHRILLTTIHQNYKYFNFRSAQAAATPVSTVVHVVSHFPTLSKTPSPTQSSLKVYKPLVFLIPTRFLLCDLRFDQQSAAPGSNFNPLQPLLLLAERYNKLYNSFRNLLLFGGYGCYTSIQNDLASERNLQLSCFVRKTSGTSTMKVSAWERRTTHLRHCKHIALH